jgi:hypothetical protein
MGRIPEIDRITNQITKHDVNIPNLKRQNEFLAKIVKKYKDAIASEYQTDLPISDNNYWFNDLENQDQPSSQATVCFGLYIDRAKFNPPEFHQNRPPNAIKKLLETSVQYPTNKLKQSHNDSSNYSVTQNKINFNNNKISPNTFPVKLKENADQSEFSSEPSDSFNRRYMITSNDEVLKIDDDWQFKEDIQTYIQKVIDEDMQPSPEFWDNNLENTASLSLSPTKNEVSTSFSSHEASVSSYEDEDLVAVMIAIDNFKKSLTSENLD